MIIAIVMLTSCGISDKEFGLVVGEYEIFDIANDWELKTVSDYAKKMESYDGEYGENLVISSVSWSEEELNENGSFLGEIEDEDFVYDDDKYYGELYVNIEVASKKDYSTREDVTYHYLFSLKDDVITLEASATSYGGDYGYENFTVGYGARDAVTACATLTSVMQDVYK